MNAQSAAPEAVPSAPASSEAKEFVAGKEIAALNGLRAVAVLAVIPHNLTLVTQPHDLGTHVLASLLDRGWAGVQIFFVLSGFLITGILIDQARAENYYASFFARRFLRILPLYYLTLTVVLGVLPLLHLLPDSVPRSPTGELLYWLFVTNWYSPFHEGEGSMRHLWSLAVEEQFYLLWPFVIHRRSVVQVAIICAGVAGASLVIRIGMLIAGAPIDAIYSFSITRMDALALGGLVAALCRMPDLYSSIARHRRLVVTLAWSVLIIGLASTRGFAFSSPWTQSEGYLLMAGSIALFILWMSSGRPRGIAGRVLESEAMQRIGRYSYGMYLLHIPLDFLLRDRAKALLGRGDEIGVLGNLSYIAVATLLTYGLASFSYRFFERRFLDMKVKFRPKYSVAVR